MTIISRLARSGVTDEIAPTDVGRANLLAPALDSYLFMSDTYIVLRDYLFSRSADKERILKILCRARLRLLFYILILHYMVIGMKQCLLPLHMSWFVKLCVGKLPCIRHMHPGWVFKGSRTGCVLRVFNHLGVRKFPRLPPVCQSSLLVWVCACKCLPNHTLVTDTAELYFKGNFYILTFRDITEKSLGSQQIQQILYHFLSYGPKHKLMGESAISAFWPFFCRHTASRSHFFIRWAPRNRIFWNHSITWKELHYPSFLVD